MFNRVAEYAKVFQDSGCSAAKIFFQTQPIWVNRLWVIYSNLAAILKMAATVKLGLSCPW